MPETAKTASTTSAQSVEPDRDRWNSLFADLAYAASLADFEGLRQRLWRSAEDIRSYLLSFHLENAPAGLIEQYVSDALPRFLRTLEFVPLPCSGSILEVGSNPYLFHVLLDRIFPEATIEGCNFFDHNIFSAGGSDLVQVIESAAARQRYEFSSKLFNIEVAEEYPYRAGQFDLVFFCETLEHLIVNPLAVFGRLRRILKPGGFLIVTLPNAVRLTNVALMLEGRNFFDIYSTNGPHGRHNREYTLAEMVALLKQNAFEVLRAETYDRCDYDLVPVWSMDYTGSAEKLRYNRSSTIEALRLSGGTTENRGDNLYLLAKKPPAGSGASSCAG